jgi:hypothetical protein
MIDHTALKLRAVVDWVEVEVTLAGRTQPHHVRDRVRRLLPHWGEPPYVAALTNSPSRSTNTIRLRVQDPPGPATLLRDLQAVVRPGDPPLTAHDLRVVGIEVSLDAYVPEPGLAALATVALHMFRHHARPPVQEPGTVPRITGPGHFRAADGGQDTLQALGDGLTINAGIRGGDYEARYYVKTTDSIAGESYATLPANLHRARMEVALRGSQLPFDNLEAWGRFNFGTLARYFALRVAAPSSVDPAWMSKIPQLGRPVDHDRAAAHKRTNRRGTRADADWAPMARNALRVMQRAQRRG